MNLGAEAATREPALIHLPDRKYHGGDWILSLPKLTIYNLLLGFSTSFNAACRIALSFPWTWLSLWWDKTREIHCSLFVTHFPLAALAACHNHCSFQGLGEQKRSQQETPRCCQHTPIRQVVKPSSLGGGRVIQDMPLEPSASDFSRNTLWKPPEPQMGSLGLALVGWVTLAPFFLQRFPAQERVHHLPAWITPSLLPETLMGSGNQRAMSPAAQLQMQHPKPAKNA